MPSKPSAFISYRRADGAALATLIAVTLKDKHGIEAFVDTRNTDGGGLFPDRLRRSIEACDVFVCLLGATTLESAWVQEEIEHAHNLRKTMIPVFQERYVAPNPIPNEHIEALLQSDGVHILDVRNIYIDQAIADLAKMIRNTVTLPPIYKLPMSIPVWLGALTALVLLLLSFMLLPSAIERLFTLIGATQIADSATPAAVTDIQSATTETAAAWTDTPAPAPTPTITLTPDPLALARMPITRNADWTPVTQDFNGVTMMLVPAGCFMMGSNDGDDNEQPVHEQCFDEPFWIDQTEVTQADFQRLGGQMANENVFDGQQRPVENITWYEARDFCALRGARLPTEREWEYAARGPDNLVYPWGNSWNEDNATSSDNNNQTTVVGSIPMGNSWVGTYDMSGNVWEWTSTLFEAYPYVATDGRESDTGYRTDVHLVLRSGSFVRSTHVLSAPYRYGGLPNIVSFDVGFRCARNFDVEG
jgi:formylglycine-generating enzyme required for sulfatase activity